MSNCPKCNRNVRSEGSLCGRCKRAESFKSPYKDSGYNAKFFVKAAYVKGGK